MDDTTRTISELSDIARTLLNPTRLNDYISFGGVAAVVRTVTGDIFTGICLDTACSMGFCAEVAAVAAMLTAGQTEIDVVVAVDWDGLIIPPCGRCRELLSQFGGHPLVAVSDTDLVDLASILRYDWKDRPRPIVT